MRHLPADEGLLHDADGALVEADARGLHAVQQVLPLRHGLRAEAVAILLVACQRRTPPCRSASRLHAHQSHDKVHTHLNSVIYLIPSAGYVTRRSCAEPVAARQRSTSQGPLPILKLPVDTMCSKDHQELYAAVLDSDLEETVAHAP